MDDTFFFDSKILLYHYYINIFKDNNVVDHSDVMVINLQIVALSIPTYSVDRYDISFIFVNDCDTDFHTVVYTVINVLRNVYDPNQVKETTFLVNSSEYHFFHKLIIPVQQHFIYYIKFDYFNLDYNNERVDYNIFSNYC